MAGQSISKGAITLTTDAAQLQSGLAKAQSAIASFSNRVTGLLSAHLSFSAISGLAEQIKSIGDESENMLNLAGVFEINVERMQAFAQAANLAGIETETLVKALRIASEKFPGESDPIASLVKAMEQLRDIPNVQERIKAASEIFGGKSAVEVLKIMKADLPGVAAGIRQISTLNEEQLSTWDKLGDAISLFVTNAKNLFKGLPADIKALVSEPELPLQQQLFRAANAFREHVGALERLGFSPSDAVNATKLTVVYKEWVAISEKVTQQINAQAAAEERRTAALKQSKVNAEFQLEQIGKMQELEDAYKTVEEVLKPDAIDQFTKVFDKLNFLFAERRLTVDEYVHGMMNLKKSLEGVGQAADEIRLPSAAFRGSVEDISARIRSSVGTEQKQLAAENVNLLRRIAENTDPLKGIGVQN